MMKRLLLLTGIAMLTFTCLKGQDVAERTLRWYSDHTIDMQSGITLPEQTTLVTAPSSIELRRDGATLNFTVLNTQGNWSGPHQNGKLVYTVLYQTAQGTITVERTAAELSFMIDFTSVSPDAMKHKIVIMDFE